jgi:ATP-dependent Clp protease ATP-binding subunit ClpC
LPTDQGAVFGHPTLAPHTKQAIELAVDEARLMEHHYVSTEHLLLGLLRQGDSMAAGVLQGLGVSFERVREQIIRRLVQKQMSGGQEVEGALPTPLSYDMTLAAEEGKFDPLIGRQAELERIIQILSRRIKNNPVLVGEHGVGKRSIVKGLAHRISNGQVPPSLLNCRLLTVNVSNLLTSAVYHFMIANRLKKTLEEGTPSRMIFFFDNIDKLVVAAETHIDTAKMIKVALSRGELQAIGSTTPYQYRTHIDTDVTREWYFQPVEVNEPSPEEAIEILHGVKPRYEEHHQLFITDEALNAAAYLASRYAVDRFLPDKAIDLIDEASSYVSTHKAVNADELRSIFLKLKQVQKMKQDATEAYRLDDAARLRHRELELNTRFLELRANSSKAANRPSVTLEDVAQVTSEWSGVPVRQIIDEERARLRKGFIR